MIRPSFPALILFTLTAHSFDANGESGGRRGHERGHEGGRFQQREERRGELDICAGQLGITLPARGSGSSLTSDQRQQLSACVQAQRTAIRAAEKAKQQADLAACAQQVGIILPTDGSRPVLTQDQRQQFRACLQQDKSTERQSFESAVKACLAANGVAPPTAGQRPPPIDAATRQKIEICVAQAANQQGSSGSVTSTATDTSVTTATATDTAVSTVTNTVVNTDTSTATNTLSINSTRTRL